MVELISKLNMKVADCRVLVAGCLLIIFSKLKTSNQETATSNGLG
jgi:hypothetical protein